MSEFKKSVTIKDKQYVNKSERKKLLRSLDIFNITETQAELLFPAKAKVQRIRLTSNTLVYTNEANQPLFYDDKGKGDMYPTLYTLKMIPDLLPTLSCPNAVMEYISNGADLMAKGVKHDESDKELKAFESLKIGEKRAIMVTGLATPVCVGTVMKTVIELRNDFSGKILKVSHFLGDALWEMGDKVPPEKVVKQKKVEEKKEEQPKQETQNSEQKAEENKQDVNIQTQGEENKEVASVDVKVDPQQEMDDLIFSCFMNSLKAKLSSKKEFPILLSTLYAKYMIPCCPENKKLNPKVSSYKKLPAFVEEMEKKGLIKTEKPKEGILYITDFDKNHPLYSRFRITVDKVDENAEKASQTKIVVQLLYQPTKNSRFLFVGEEDLKNSYFNMQEVKNKFLSYLESHPQTSCNEKQFFVLDSELAKLWKGRIEGEKIEKKEITKNLELHLKKFCEIVRDGHSVLSKVIPKIDVTVLKKSSNKYVTHIFGLKDFGFDEKEIAQNFQISFATSSSVQTNESGRDFILVLGDISEQIKTTLEKDFGIPLSNITITKLATKKKKK